MWQRSRLEKLRQVPRALRKGSKPKKLLTLVREAIQRRHMSGRTEESYVSWIKRYIYFHGRHHPATIGEREVEAFLMHLAVTGYWKSRVYLSIRQTVYDRTVPAHELLEVCVSRRLLFGHGAAFERLFQPAQAVVHYAPF